MEEKLRIYMQKVPTLVDEVLASTFLCIPTIMINKCKYLCESKLICTYYYYHNIYVGHGVDIGAYISCKYLLIRTYVTLIMGLFRSKQ